MDAPLFWVAAAAMVVAALAFVLVPLLARARSAGLSPVDASLQVLRGQRREIDQDVESGTLAADARDEALNELVARAERDLAPAADAATAAGRPWAVAAAMGVALPVLAFGLYFAVGNRGALAPPTPGSEGRIEEAQIAAMVDELARKVRERPGDTRGWSLLARSLGALGRHAEAVEAYEHLVKLEPGDASILADFADALAMSQGRNLSGRPYELVKQALAIDPSNQKALALAGTAALNEGDFAASQRHWQALASLLPADSEDAARLQAILLEVRERAAAAGTPLAAAKPPVKPGATGTAAAAAGSVAGRVSLAPALAAKLAGTETVFVFARSEKGPRAPLAVLRATAKDLPLAFELTDAMAMAPGLTISSAQSLRIEARVSKSGEAMPKPGDLVGSSVAVKPGTREVAVLIDREIAKAP